MSEAKRAAGGKNVLVHGAGTAQLALAAGVLDELEIHLIPVLFGQGRRLFDNLAPEHIELERTRILEGEAVSPTCTTGSSAERRIERAYDPGAMISIGPAAVRPLET
jgi:dihydrofolate reductase